jgi:hypothetical protein
LQVGDQRLFANLADRRGQRLLAGFDHALGKIPMVESAQEQEFPTLRCRANHDYSG